MKYCILFICLVLSFGCSTIVERPEIKGFVFDKISKHPIVNAEINIDGKTEARTDKKGMFLLKIVTSRKLLDFENGHDPKMYLLIINHPFYISDTIEEKTRGSFSKDIKLYDSIFISKK